MRLSRLLPMLFFIALLPAAPAVHAERRALVIGSGAFENVAVLRTPVEDARTVAQALEGVGYKVTLRLDPKSAEMKAALREFIDATTKGDETFVYYAGHALGLARDVYLLPVDAKGESESQARNEAVLLGHLIHGLLRRGPAFALTVVDASRGNPFQASGRSLGERTLPLAFQPSFVGQMLVFAAGSEERGVDRLGDGDGSPNSLFARVLAKAIMTNGKPVDVVMKDVREQVARLAEAAGHRQRPIALGSAVSDFYFREDPRAMMSPPPALPLGEITKVVYRFQDRSVPPQYHRSYTIEVEREASSCVVDSYGTILSTKRYAEEPAFLEELKSALSIEALQACKIVVSRGCKGGTGESLSAMRDEQQVFRRSVSHCGNRAFGDVCGPLISEIKHKLAKVACD